MYHFSAGAPSEADRYRPFTTMLNILIKTFRDKQYGVMPPPSSTADKEEILFVTNDPKVIESKYLSTYQEEQSSKRKPDIIGVYLSHLREKYEEHRDCDLVAMTEAIAQGHIPKAEEGLNNPTYPSTKWKDVHLTWELKRSRVIPLLARKQWNMADLKKKFSAQKPTTRTPKPKAPKNPQLHGPTRTGSNTASERGSMGPPKRPRDEESEQTSNHASKKSRMSADSANAVPPAQKPEKVYDKIPTEVQCAYYGAERLAASSAITHSIVILVSGIFPLNPREALTLKRGSQMHHFHCVGTMRKGVFKAVPSTS